MVATLIGGTGLTGSFLLQRLLADPAVTKVISISRKPLRISNTKLTEVLVSNLAQLPSIEAKIRGELYFCCLGTTIKAAGSKENFEKVDHAAIAAFARIDAGLCRRGSARLLLDHGGRHSHRHGRIARFPLPDPIRQSGAD